MVSIQKSFPFKSMHVCLYLLFLKELIEIKVNWQSYIDKIVIENLKGMSPFHFHSFMAV